MPRDVPPDLRYTKDHEWVRVEGALGRIGITDFAQDQLTDVVYVNLRKPGTRVRQHDVLGEVESIKSVSEIFSPVSGDVVEVNPRLTEDPGLVNREPYGSGWLCVVRFADAGQVAALLGEKEYRAQTER